MKSGKQMRIGEMVAQTGLSERMIRHYEALGLIQPDRSLSNQRLYGPDTLVTLSAIQLLKRAGLKLKDIGSLLKGQADIDELLRAQLDLARQEADRLQQAVAILEIMTAEVAGGGTQDPVQLAKIIRLSGQQPQQAAARFFQRHFSDAQRTAWANMMDKLGEKIDWPTYDADWKALCADIADALPLDPASAQGQAFRLRWDELLKPFRSVASTEQRRLGQTMWSHVGQWQDAAPDRVTQDVIDFIKAAYRAAATTKKE